MRIPACLILGATLATSATAQAAVFDGKSTVLCATLEAVHCSKSPDSAHQCTRGTAAALAVPQFVKLDFANKRVTATEETGLDKTSAIASVARGNGHLVVQGVDEGHGWSLVLEENTGRMTASTIGDEEGLMIFGACTQI